MPSRGLQHDVNVLGGAWLLRRVIGGGVKIILHTNFILLLLPNSVLSINFCAGQIVEDAQRAALAGSRREHTRHETIPKVLTEALEKTSSSLCRSVRREELCPREEQDNTRNPMPNVFPACKCTIHFPACKHMNVGKDSIYNNPTLLRLRALHTHTPSSPCTITQLDCFRISVSFLCRPDDARVACAGWQQ